MQRLLVGDSLTDHRKRIFAYIILSVAALLILFVTPAPDASNGKFGSLFHIDSHVHTCVSNAFNPSGGAMRKQDLMSIDTVDELRYLTRFRWIHMAGDSTIRQVYYALIDLLNRENANIPLSEVYVPPSEAARRHETRHGSLKKRLGSTTVSFTWAPMFKDVRGDWEKTSGSGSVPDVVLYGAGLWDLLHEPDTFDQELEATASLLDHATPPLVFWKTVSRIIDSRLQPHHQSEPHFRDASVIAKNKLVWDLFERIPAIVPIEGYLPSDDDLSETDIVTNNDGIHSRVASESLAYSLASSITNCNSVAYQYSPGQIAVGLLLMVFMITALVLEARSYIASKSNTNEYSLVSSSSLNNSQEDIPMKAIQVEEVKEAKEANTDEASTPSSLQSPSSSSSLSSPNCQLEISTFRKNIRAAALMGSIMLALFLFDGPYRLFGSYDKNYSRDFFAFLNIVCLIIFFSRIRNTHKNSDDILNRDQTEEWKGIMQVFFLLYHYFNAGEVYNMIRIFIAAYVWMTGYGNFMFFYHKEDYSFSRVAKMMFRLNFLVTLVCLTMNSEYMLYYVCPLHTTFFCLCYATMYLGSSHNKNNKVMWMKLIIVFVILFVIFDMPSLKVFDTLFGWASLFYMNGSLHEWRFRSTLDHYATWLGMVCAFLLPVYTAFWKKLESQPSRKQHINKAIIAAVCIIMTGLWSYYILPQDKYSYNAQHPYTFWIPVLSYIVLRNFSPLLRRWVSPVLCWMGRRTLETYIFQFHVWLAVDARELVEIFPSEYPLVNFVATSAVYMFLAHGAFELTGTLSDALIPRKAAKERALVAIFACTAVWLVIYALVRIWLL